MTSAALALAWGASGCVGGGGRVAEERPPPIEAAPVPEYRLGAGDVIAVSVRNNPDLSVEVPVRSDGHVTVPLIGDVLAGGRTPAALAGETERKLARYLRAPQVSITVVGVDGAGFRDRVRVIGGVAEPTSVPYRAGMTVVDLVLEAGGLNELASPDDARLHRTVDGERRAYPVYLGGILGDGAVDTNYTLVPGDVISVPERRF